MKKIPLSKTNPFLKNPEDRRFWLFKTVTSSAAIEGVHLSREDLEILQCGTHIPKLIVGKPSKIKRK
jgi:Fic family protein